LGFNLRTSPRCSLGFLEKELSFRLGLVVLVAPTWNAFSFLDTFNLPIIRGVKKLVCTNSPQIREDFEKFVVNEKRKEEGMSRFSYDSQ
jgi:hypothetical protein